MFYHTNIFNIDITVYKNVLGISLNKQYHIISALERITDRKYTVQQNATFIECKKNKNKKQNNNNNKNNKNKNKNIKTFQV